MARTATTALKTAIDASFGVGATVKLLAAINSTHTAFDPLLRTIAAKVLGSIGEATAFESACTGNSSLSVAAINKLEHELHGRGNAEELALCVTDGTVT